MAEQLMFRRPWSRLQQTASALSCLLNAATGGPRTVTFSAWSWDLHTRRSFLGRLRVCVVDLLNLDPDHCRESWDAHVARGLIVPDNPGASAP